MDRSTIPKMRHASVTVALALIFPACSEPTVDSFPSDLTWAAFLTETDGVIQRGTPLSRADADALVWPSDLGEDAIVVGWSDEVIRALAPPDDRILQDPVAAASPCAQPLPAPTFIARRDQGSSPALGALTVAWHADACESVAPEDVRIGSSCQRGRCIPARIDQEGCCLDLDLTPCGVGNVRIGRDNAGTVVVEAGEEVRCLGAPPVDDAIDAFTCDEPQSCRVDVYSAPAETNLPIDRLRLYDVPPLHPAPNDDELAGAFLSVGYVTDFVLVRNTAFAVGWGGVFRGFGCEASDPPAELLEIDLNQLRLVATSSLPDCTRDLAPDPLQRGVFASYGETESLQIGLFDREGRRLMARGLPDLFPNEPELRFDAIATIPAPPRLIVALTAGSEASTRFVTLLAENLEPVATSSIVSGHGLFMERGRGSQVVYADDDSNEVIWFDAVANRVVGRAFAGGRGTKLMRPRYVDTIQAVLQPSAGLLGGMFRVSESGLEGYQAFFSFDLDVTTSAIRGDRLLVAGMVRGGDRAHVTFMDPEPRFSAASQDVGFGAVAKAETDPNGNVILLLPWSGELLRIGAEP